MRFMCVLLTTMVLGVGQAQSFDFDKAWENVNESIEKGLPESALTGTLEIYQNAESGKNADQYTKALVYLSSIKFLYGEDVVSEVDSLFKTALTKTATPYREIIHAYYAMFINRYLSENRYAISSRTTALENGAIHTLSAEKLEQLVDDHLRISTVNLSLIDYPITSYPLLVEQQDADAIDKMPTLLHVVSQISIQYYSNKIQEEEADNDWTLLSFNEFLNKGILSSEKTAWSKLGRLFINLQKLNVKKEYLASTAYFELERIKLISFSGTSTADYEKKRALLKEDIKTFRRTPFVTHFYAEAAVNEINTTARDKFLEAFKLCEEALSLYPKTSGAVRCRQIRDEVLQKSLNVMAESTYSDNDPWVLRATTRNIDKLYIRLIKHPGYFSLWKYNGDETALRTQLISEKVVLSQTLDIKDLADHNEVVTDAQLKPQKLGKYLMLVSNSPDFKQAFSVTPVLVSNLAYANPNGVLNDFVVVVNRKSGKPVKGAKVKFYTFDYTPGEGSVRKEIGSATSDKEGKAKKPSGIQQLGVAIVKGKDEFDSNASHYSGNGAAEFRSYVRNEIFTDRPIYRPGHEVKFKVLSMMVSELGIPAIRSHETVEVVLNDANGQKVQSLQLTTNEWGSVSGSFRIPEGRLNGYFHLVCGDQNKYFRVEEYKRPRFEVKLDSLNDGPLLGATVEVKGSAAFFSGLALQEAKVNYRVTRREIIPFCYRWYPGIFNQQDVVVAQGETSSDSNGSFVFNFVAEASASQKWRPNYLFELNVDVISPDGETQSATQSLLIRQEPYTVEVNMSNQVDKSGNMKGLVVVKDAGEETQYKEVAATIHEMAGPSALITQPYWDNFENEASYEKISLPPVPFRDWKPVKLIHQQKFISSEIFDYSFLPPGVYQIEFLVENCTPVKEYVIVTDFMRKKLPPVKHVLHDFNKVSFEAGETLEMMLGATGEKQMVYLSLMRGNLTLHSGWLEVNRNTKFHHTITEADKGGLSINYWYIKNNRFYMAEQAIEVPWSDKELDVKWISIKDKIDPGSKEKIRLQITGSKVTSLSSEVLATMYDASLDALEKHHWETGFFPYHYSYLYWDRPGFELAYNQFLNAEWNQLPDYQESVPVETLPQLISGVNGVYNMIYHSGFFRSAHVAESALMDAAPAPKGAVLKVGDANAGSEQAQEPAPKAQPNPRKNLKELVFFFPHLNTDEAGNLSIDFTMNEALTSWHLMLFAHNRQLASVVADKTLKTVKEWMILPNMPRLIRKGDRITITAMIANQSETTGSAEVLLQLKNHLSGEDNNAWITSPVKKVIEMAGKSQQMVSWELNLEDREATILEYTVSVITSKGGDAETGLIPLVSDEVLLTETLPLIIRPGEQQKINFAPLQKSGDQKQLPLKYAIEMTSHPAWLAIQAMPYVLDRGYDNAIDISDKLYMTALSAAIRNQYPQIDKVLENWAADSSAQKSSLSQLENWKTVSLAETPWVGIAQQENEQMSRLVQLFDPVYQQNEWAKWKDRLMELRMGDGSFGWFKGGSYNHYTTCRVVMTAGKIYSLGVEPEIKDWMSSTLAFLDRQLMEKYHRLQQDYKNDVKRLEQYVPDEDIIAHLYARSYFRSVPFEENAKQAYQYYREQALKNALKYSLQLQVWLAHCDYRYKGNAWKNTVASLLEKSKFSSSQGMYWNVGNGLKWQEMPVETHAAIVELLYETGSDAGKLEEMKIWLLTHKKTHHWSSTRATADALTALLLHKGPRQVHFMDAESIKVTADNVRLPQNAQIRAGSGYFLQSWNPKDIRKELANIELSNQGTSVGLGAVFYQYLSPVQLVASSIAGTTTVSKKLYKELRNGNKTELTPLTVNDVLAPGDVLVTRISIVLDRDLQFVHIKDLRASGMEPYQPISGYRWGMGISYFENITDAANHYFFDHLAKGNHMLESRQRVVHRGRFSGGLIQLECLYAPEFNAHSAGSVIDVR